MTTRGSTREHLRETALRLFAENGYDAVSVAQVAREAGVSHMTFFRHFATKESVVVADLFDPAIAAAVHTQPSEWAPLRRAVHGLVAALDDDEARHELDSEEFLRRVTLAASTPSLRGAVRVASETTERAIADALARDCDPKAARAAAAAVMGAATAILLGWVGESEVERTDPATALREGLLSLVAEQ